MFSERLRIRPSWRPFRGWWKSFAYFLLFRAPLRHMSHFATRHAPSDPRVNLWRSEQNNGNCSQNMLGGGGREGEAPAEPLMP
jgi:hypothetical protein